MIAVIAIIVGLVVFNILFLKPAPFWWLEATWSSGDFLTFLGTVTLGAVSIYQTKMAMEQSRKANEISDQLLEIESERYKLQIRPFVMISNIKICDFQKDEITDESSERFVKIVEDGVEERSLLKMVLTLQNTTEAFVNVSLESFFVDNVQQTTSPYNTFGTKLQLLPRTSGEISFFAREEYFKKLCKRKLRWNFILQNRFSEEYVASIETRIFSLLKPETSNTEWFFYWNGQENNVKERNGEKHNG